VQGDDDSDSPDTIQLVLVKSIAHAPFSADFSLCMALLGDRMSTLLSTSEQLQAFETASRLSLFLRDRDFPQFWATLSSSDFQQDPLYPAVESLPSFATLVRKSIAVSIANTFRSLPKARAQQWLGFTAEQGNELESFAKDVMSWTIEGDSVTIPSNEANDPKNTVQSETVDLSSKFAPSYTSKGGTSLIVAPCRIGTYTCTVHSGVKDSFWGQL
jgi:translation initiation factor 3 subunit K